VSETVTTETQDILDMFFGIQFALKELPTADVATLNLDRLTFQGLDATRDAAHYDQAKFIVERLGLFQELKKVRLDSPSQTNLMWYRRMLPLYKAGLAAPTGLNLELLEQLQQV
jgi:uncharacterized protein YfbU (UPF0304 family)